MIASRERQRHAGQHSTLESAIAAHEGARADYQAAKKTRFNERRSGLPSNGGSGDYHIRYEYEYYLLIEDAYDLERNDALAGQLLSRVATNVIQDGMRLEPKTGDKSLDVDLKQMWCGWADDPEQCDIAGESTFHDFELAAYWTQLLAGDCGISLTHFGPLQFFEPWLIRKETANRHETFLGVDLDDDRRRMRYWIAEDPIDAYDQRHSISHPIETLDAEGRRQFFHIYDVKRKTQTRGVTAFAPVFELTGMLEDVNFAKLVQQQVVSCVAFLVEQVAEQNGNPLPATGANYGDERLEASPSGARRLYDTLEPGAEVDAGPGRKVTGFSPNIPNTEYFQQYRLILQLICGALNLPLSIGMLDGSETNFHGFIGAANEAQQMWRASQRNQIKRFNRPAYIGKLYHFMDEDRHFRNARRRLGTDFFRHHWHPPVWGSVKSLDDTQDRLMRIRNAITSPSQIQSELNRDYEDHVAETIRDYSYMIEAAKTEAIRINAQYDDGQPVNWRELYPSPMPDGIQATTEIVKDSEARRLAEQSPAPATQQQPAGAAA